MTNIFAILVLSSGFSVAIETDSGFTERSFSNDESGVAQFVLFTRAEVAKEDHHYKVCVINPSGPSGAIVEWLLENDMHHASVSPAAYANYLSKSNAPAKSAISAAHACLATFPFLRKLG